MNLQKFLWAGWKFRTIEGRVIERDIGEAIIEYPGERATRIVVFAEEGDADLTVKLFSKKHCSQIH